MAKFGAMPGMVLVEISPLSGGFGRLKTFDMYVIDFVARTVGKVDIDG